MQTRLQLATLKKGSKSITEYFHKFKSLASSFSAAGQPLSHSEFTVYLLADLGFNYESLVTSLTTRPEPLSSSQIYSYLLNHESRLAHQTKSLLSGTPLITNIATFKPTTSSFNRGHGRNSRRGRGAARSSPGPSSSFTPTSRLVCQICSKTGHTTLQCYHQLDQSYKTPTPPSLMAHYTALPPSVPSKNCLFSDTVTTNHFTADFSNLNLDFTSYIGID